MVEELVELFGREEVVIGPELRPAAQREDRGSGEVRQEHPLVRQLDRELALRGYRGRTRTNYCLYAVRFLRWQDREPIEATGQELRSYLQEMSQEGLFPSYCNQARALLQVLYAEILGRPGKVEQLPRMNEAEQLPVVLSREKVVRLLGAIIRRRR